MFTHKLDIYQGPRQKSNNVYAFENLIKAILIAHANKKNIAVDYNTAEEIIISIDDQVFNLARILEAQLDWEHLIFNKEDISRYDNFLNDPNVKYGHINLAKNQANFESDSIDLNKVSQHFPHLSLAECSAIRNYTKGFYSAINFIIRTCAKRNFPINPDLNDFKKILNEYKTLDGRLDLNQLVIEILLHSAFIASASNKSYATEIEICLSPSVDDIKEAIKNGEMTNSTLAIIGNSDTRDVVFIAANEIFFDDSNTLDIHNFFTFCLQQKEGKDLTKFSKEEVEQLIIILSDATDLKVIDLNILHYRFLANLSLFLNDKIYDPELILFRADRKNAHINTFVEGIEKDLRQMPHTQRTTTGFYSTSEKLQTDFFLNKKGVITEILTTVSTVLPIAVLSVYPNEKERLFMPGQELVIEKMANKNGHIHFFGRTTRSLQVTDKKINTPKNLERTIEVEETGELIFLDALNKIKNGY